MRRVLVTRPAQDAAQWVADLQAQGIAAEALPLIAITASPTNRAALLAARERLARHPAFYRAVMFVSGNAAAYFFESNQAPTLAGKALAALETRAWTPGPGTARVLLQCGVPAECIDGPAPDAAQFDSEALWARVAPQVRPGDRVLVVRGASTGAPAGPGQGRDWLAARIHAAGGQVDFVVAYERGAPAFDAPQQALARRAAHDGTLWLFSSSEAIAHLAQALPGQDWAAAHALATHPRIAQAARAAGFGCVSECKPALADVAAFIKSCP